MLRYKRCGNEHDLKAAQAKSWKKSFCSTIEAKMFFFSFLLNWSHNCEWSDPDAAEIYERVFWAADLCSMQ